MTFTSIFTVNVTVEELWKTYVNNAGRLAWEDGDTRILQDALDLIKPVLFEDSINPVEVNKMFADCLGCLLIPWYDWERLMKHKGIRRIHILDETTGDLIIVPHINII